MKVPLSLDTQQSGENLGMAACDFHPSVGDRDRDGNRGVTGAFVTKN